MAFNVWLPLLNTKADNCKPPFWLFHVTIDRSPTELQGVAEHDAIVAKFEEHEPHMRPLPMFFLSSFLLCLSKCA
jgi:hypothetical protein